MASRSILMPKLGLTMEEGSVAEWKVAPGDRVSIGDIIFVVETDKIANDIEAVEAGVVETLCVKAGDIVPVGEVVATLIVECDAQRYATSPGTPDQNGAMLPGKRATSMPKQTPAPLAQSRNRRIATPHARRIAQSAGLELASIHGSGPRGRIVADDVDSAMQARKARGELAAESGGDVVSPENPGLEHGKLIPFGQHQKVLARRLGEAKREIPHFYVFAEADITSLLQLRTRLNANADRVKLSVTHFIITAVARAIATTPKVNVVWSVDGLIEFRDVDIGIAVESSHGLVAPVLRNIGSSCLQEIAQKAILLVERARANRLTQEDLQGGVTSVSNVGMFGPTGLVPIINPGQSTILGVGRAQAVFRPDARQQPQLRQVLSLSLSCDHRAIDGALAARFLTQIQKGLEEPVELLRGTPQAHLK
jgi:pyruvate dehydrogenase E2 component (dihydrolipoamide acetyltransferase)